MLEGSVPGSFGDEMFDRMLIQALEGFGLCDGSHVIQAKTETVIFELLKSQRLDNAVGYIQQAHTLASYRPAAA